MRDRSSSVADRRFSSLEFARLMHLLATHGETREVGTLRRALWDEHCRHMYLNGEPHRSILCGAICSLLSHFRYRLRAENSTFLPAGMALTAASLVGIVVAYVPDTPQHPAAYLHLALALGVLGAVCIARPLRPSPPGLQLGAAVLLTAIVHFSVGYQANNTAELLLYPGSALLIAGCLNIVVRTKGLFADSRQVLRTVDLFIAGLAIYGVVIVLRSMDAASVPMGWLFLGAGFATALVANFLLRCRSWLRTMA